MIQNVKTFISDIRSLHIHSSSPRETRCPRAISQHQHQQHQRPPEQHGHGPGQPQLDHSKSRGQRRGNRSHERKYWIKHCLHPIPGFQAPGPVRLLPAKLHKIFGSNEDREWLLAVRQLHHLRRKVRGYPQRHGYRKRYFYRTFSRSVRVFVSRVVHVSTRRWTLICFSK